MIAPSGVDRRRECIPIRTFSSAVMLAKSRMFWNVRAIPREVTSSGRSAARPTLASAAAKTGSPSIRISPVLGR